MTNACFYDLISHSCIFFLCGACSHIWPFFKKSMGYLSFYDRVVVLYIVWIHVFCLSVFYMYCDLSPNLYLLCSFLNDVF